MRVVVQAVAKVIVLAAVKAIVLELAGKLAVQDVKINVHLLVQELAALLALKIVVANVRLSVRKDVNKSAQITVQQGAIWAVTMGVT